MKYDDLVEYLGEFGPYQRKIYMLSCLPVIAAAIQTLIPVFILAVPDHRCAIPGLPNDTYSLPQTLLAQHQSLVNHTLLWTDADPDDASDVWGSAECTRYMGRSVSTFDPVAPSNTTGLQQEACTEWVYDTEVFENSFVTEQSWVCDDKVLKSHANMIYMAAMFFGSMGFGLFSDAYGRKTAFTLALITNIGSAVALRWSPNFAVFSVLRFITGMGNVGIFTCCFVLGVELVGRKYRPVAGNAIQFFWCFGMMVLDFVAYMIRDWKTLQLACSCYAVVFLLLWWAVPESPRWLLNKGRVDEAKVTLEKVAKANHKTLPADAFDNDDDEVVAPKGSILDIFKSKILTFRIIVVFINWLMVTMVYYGLTLNVGSLGGSIYVNFAISGLVEWAAAIVTIPGIQYMGRRNYHCSTVVLGGVACLCSAIPVLIGGGAPDWVNIVLSNIGKFGASAGFNTIYIFTAELFPTPMRNSVVGASSMVARVGGMVAPYIADLGTVVGGSFGEVIPFVVFGACAVFAGILALTLPETLNKPLPETIEDAINFGKEKETKDVKSTNLGQDNQAFSNGTKF